MQPHGFAISFSRCWFVFSICMLNNNERSRGFSFSIFGIYVLPVRCCSSDFENDYCLNQWFIYVFISQKSTTFIIEHALNMNK